MNDLHLRGATLDSVVRHLDSAAEVSLQDLQAAVANMAERIASLEQDRDQLAQALRWFHEDVARAEAVAASDTGQPPTHGS